MDRCAAATAARIHGHDRRRSRRPRSLPATTIRTISTTTCNARRSVSCSSTRSPPTAIRSTTRSRGLVLRQQTGRLGHGHCGTRQDAVTYKYVRYSASASSGAGFDPTAFTRVDITPASGGSSSTVCCGQPERPHVRAGDGELRQVVRVLPDPDAGDADRGRPRVFGAQRGQRARRLSHAVGEQQRDPLPERQAVSTRANKATWFTSFYAAAPTSGTPLPDAVWRIGEYFSGISRLSGLRRRHSTRSIPPPANASRTTTCCRPTATGTPLDARDARVASTSVGDRDQTVPGACRARRRLHTGAARFRAPITKARQRRATAWPTSRCTTGSRDIRPDLANKVKDTDRAWQHVTLYGLSIGARGNASSIPTGIDAITSRAPRTGRRPDRHAGGPDSIDDLWHAAVNSRGKYFNAKNPQQLAESIVSALADFTDQSGTGTAVGIAGAQFSATKNFGYRTSYEAGLVGRRQEIRARPEHRRAARRHRRQSAQCAAVVGRDAARRAGRRARAGTRIAGS